jgi:hypothetical protein
MLQHAPAGVPGKDAYRKLDRTNSTPVRGSRMVAWETPRSTGCGAGYGTEQRKLDRGIRDVRVHRQWIMLDGGNLETEIVLQKYEDQSDVRFELAKQGTDGPSTSPV